MRHCKLPTDMVTAKESSGRRQTNTLSVAK